MDRIDDRLREALHMMLNIKTSVYAEYSGTEYDSEGTYDKGYRLPYCEGWRILDRRARQAGI